MGICYSSVSGKRYTDEEEEEEEGCWWKNLDNSSNSISSSKRRTNSDATSKKTYSGDFTSFISKFGGKANADDRAPHHLPGKLFGNGSSSIASLHTQQGKKGTNQDAMIVWENFSSRGDTVFCGVFDGHGPHGHLVARRVRDFLPVLLCNEMKVKSSDNQNCPCDNGNAVGNGNTTTEECVDEDWCQPVEIEGNSKLPDMYMPLKQAILKAFKLMDKELKLHQTIDCFCSGSTAVTLIKQGQDLILGNVGDSRAVLARRDKDDSLTAVQLTVDLKPNLPREAARIEQCKGRVFALQDEPEVARVWLPNSDSPGLAMARAFGDFCLKDFGLISVPDVYYRRLTERDKFIVLATDGVWDVLSNKEAIDIVASAPSRATAARALVDCATRGWKLKYPTSKNDDCAVVCLFLDHLSVDNMEMTENDSTKSPKEAVLKISETNENTRSSDIKEGSASHVLVHEHSGNNGGSGEIVPVSEPAEEKLPEKSVGQSKRSLAECLTTTEDEEWSALEGITRVNSLLSIPRFLSGDKRSASWRKWL